MSSNSVLQMYFLLSIGNDAGIWLFSLGGRVFDGHPLSLLPRSTILPTQIPLGDLKGCFK